MMGVVVVVTAGSGRGSSSDGHGVMSAGDDRAGRDLSLGPAGGSTLAGGVASGLADGRGAGGAFDSEVTD